MSLLGLFREQRPPPPAVAAAPADPGWVKPPKGYYHRLLSIRLELAKLRGVGGVYVVWHRGVRPAWVHVGATEDLAASLAEARDTPEILAYESRGGLHVTWSPIIADYRMGVLAHLREAMSPELDMVLPTDLTPRRARPVPVKLPA